MDEEGYSGVNFKWRGANRSPLRRWSYSPSAQHASSCDFKLLFHQSQH